MLVLRPSNLQGATARPIVPKQTLYCHQFSSALQFQNHVELFSTS